MLALWTLFPLLLFTDTLWRSPTFMHTLLPGLYTWLQGLLPQEWRESSVDVTPVRAVTLVLYFLVISSIWLAYIAAVRAANKPRTPDPVPDPRPSTPNPRHRPLLPILLGTLLFSIPALLWPAMFSDDVFAYAAQGKMQVEYGLNPLVDPPIRMGNDPLVNLSPWKDIPTTYGPVWLGATRGVAAVVQPLGGRPVAYLVAFKLLNVGLILAGVALVWAIGGRLGWGLERRRAACVLFGWCPLLIFDLVGSAHNDILLDFFILLALWLHVRGWWPLAVGAIMLGGLVKLSGFFLLPAYLVLLWRESQRWQEGARRAGIGVGIAAGVGVLAYLPYAYDGLLKGLLSNPLAGSFGPSVGLSVRQALVDLGIALRGRGTPLDWTVEGMMEALKWPIWNGALILWAIIALGISLTPRDFPGLIRAWALVYFTYMVIGSVWFMPWYITWLVPMLALLPLRGRQTADDGRQIIDDPRHPSPVTRHPTFDTHLRRAIILFAWGGTLFYALTPSLPWDRTTNLQNYYVPGIIFAPPLLYVAWVGASALIRNVRALRGRQTTDDRRRVASG